MPTTVHVSKRHAPLPNWVPTSAYFLCLASFLAEFGSYARTRRTPLKEHWHQLGGMILARISISLHCLCFSHSLAVDPSRCTQRGRESRETTNYSHVFLSPRTFEQTNSVFTRFVSVFTSHSTRYNSVHTQLYNFGPLFLSIPRSYQCGEGI